jgi:hypothetical protein
MPPTRVGVNCALDVSFFAADLPMRGLVLSPQIAVTGGVFTGYKQLYILRDITLASGAFIAMYARALPLGWPGKAHT